MVAAAGMVLAGEGLPLQLVCGSNNDLYRVLEANGVTCSRHDTAAQAVDSAGERAGLVILADEYPQRTVAVDATIFESAAKKKLRLFVEFPATLPGMTIPETRPLRFERGVVASDFFGESLPQLRILGINSLHVQPLEVAQAHLVAARVAGVDRAVFGLPQETYPLLFEHPRGDILVATTQLSRFLTARYAPQEAWQTVWRGILGWLQPQREPPWLRWTPVVRPAYGPDDALPLDAEMQAFRRGVEWFYASKLLMTEHVLPQVEAANRRLGTGMIPTPPPESPAGDGTLGIMEAQMSSIQLDGTQLIGGTRRGDCTAESAMAMAFACRLLKDPRHDTVARNLLDFYLFKSTARKNERGDPNSSAYGLIAWGITTPAWYRANYGDDAARTMLGALAVSALTDDDRWDEAVMQCLLANLRTTGKYGFRHDRIDLLELRRTEWRSYFDDPYICRFPATQAYLWACFLWAYQRTGFDPFYERTETAIRMTMTPPPVGFRKGGIDAPIRMLLPLAWLVRVKDTPEHRAWLKEALDAVLKLQEPCGAIRQEIGHLTLKSNERYGTHETSVVQENGDPVSDQLYAVNFALLGLHEAASLDPRAKEAEDNLAGYLCRIQNRSDSLPSLDGGWFRAFHFGHWEAWASNADAGWGAWTVESGWSQSWIVSVLALRQMNTTLWDLTARSSITRHFEKNRKLMLPDEAPAGKPVPVSPAAVTPRQKT